MLQSRALMLEVDLSQETSLLQFLFSFIALRRMIEDLGTKFALEVIGGVTAQCIQELWHQGFKLKMY